jgi:hypothetical protein
MSTTRPETVECTGDDKNACVSPIFCPTCTVSPMATVGSQGAPMCCTMGYTISAPLRG